MKHFFFFFVSHSEGTRIQMSRELSNQCCEHLIRPGGIQVDRQRLWWMDHYRFAGSR